MPTRRTVLTAALAGVLAGCTAESPARVSAPQDPDEVLAREALAAVTAILALVDATSRHRPRRRRALAATRSVHQAHVDLLGATLPPGSPTADVSPGHALAGADSAAYLALARAEEQLGATLSEGALRARSGALARVLAAMAAAAAQQSAVLRRLA